MKLHEAIDQVKCMNEAFTRSDAMFRMRHITGTRRENDIAQQIRDALVADGWSVSTVAGKFVIDNR